MQRKYEEIMKSVDSQIAAIDLNGENIINDCQTIILFLKDKLNELKEAVLLESFSDEAEEIVFFKYQKPMVLGRLMYFYRVLHIESHKPPYDEMIDEYYRKEQEKQKVFFDQVVGFYQYYRSEATYRDSYYFVRGKKEIISPDSEIYLFDEEPGFTTGYDRLIARIVSMEMLYAYLTARRKALLNSNENQSSCLLEEHHWTGKIADLVEIIYGIHTLRCVDNGEISIEDLTSLFSNIFNVEVKNCFSSYTEMKKRKEQSRTYFLDELSRQLNERMNRDEEKGYRRVR